MDRFHILDDYRKHFKAENIKYWAHTKKDLNPILIQQKFGL